MKVIDRELVHSLTFDVPLSDWGDVREFVSCIGNCYRPSPSFDEPSDCAEVDAVIEVITATNETMLSNALNRAFACWTRTEKASFIVYKRQIEKHLWNQTAVRRIFGTNVSLSS